MLDRAPAADVSLGEYLHPLHVRIRDFEGLRYDECIPRRAGLLLLGLSSSLCLTRPDRDPASDAAEP